MICKILLCAFSVAFLIGFTLLMGMSAMWIIRFKNPYEVVDAIMILIIGILGIRDGLVMMKKVFQYITN